MCRAEAMSERRAGRQMLPGVLQHKRRLLYQDDCISVFEL